jgi:hypothetical protein
MKLDSEQVANPAPLGNAGTAGEADGGEVAG